MKNLLWQLLENLSGESDGKFRSEERFSRNAETDIVCRLLLEKKEEGGLGSGRGRAAGGVGRARRARESRGRALRRLQRRRAQTAARRPARPFLCFFFFNDTATTEIYPLSLHDALPISRDRPRKAEGQRAAARFSFLRSAF